MHTLLRLTSALVTAGVLLAPVAQADILDDIMSVTTAARDRATQARDNAASARDRATEARGYALTARDNAANARDFALTARDNAAAARDTALQMRDNMLAGFELLTANMEAAIQEAVEDLAAELNDEVAGRDAFIQGGLAGPFRDGLIALLGNMAGLMNALGELGGLPGATFDFSRSITILELLPDRALYPLYRALSVETHIVGLGERGTSFDALVAGARADLEIIAGMLTYSPETVPGNVLDQELSDCAYVTENLAAIRQAASNLSKFSLAARGVGTMLKMLGETQVQKKVSVWGWAGVVVKNSWVKKIGIALDGMGSAVGSLSSSVSDRTQYCAAIAIENESRQRELEIIALLKRTVAASERR